MLSEPATLAIIVAIPSVLAIGAPIFMQWMTGRQRTAEIVAANTRLDLVADRAEAAERAVRLYNENAAKERRDIEAKLIGIQAQGEQIHTLANSNLTEQMGVTLAATEATLAAKEALNAVKSSTATAADIELLRKSVEDQKKAIADRKLITDEAARKRTAVDTHVMAIKETVKLDIAADKMIDAADTMAKTADKAEVVIDKIKKP